MTTHDLLIFWKKTNKIFKRKIYKKGGKAKKK